MSVASRRGVAVLGLLAVAGVALLLWLRSRDGESDGADAAPASSGAPAGQAGARAATGAGAPRDQPPGRTPPLPVAGDGAGRLPHEGLSREEAPEPLGHARVERPADTE